MKYGILVVALLFSGSAHAQSPLPVPGMPLPPQPGQQQPPTMPGMMPFPTTGGQPQPTPGPMPLPPTLQQPQPSSGAGPMPLPPGWGTSGQPPAAAPSFNIVGEWNVQGTSGGVPIVGIFVFQANGSYNEFLRFPQTPVLGNQIVQVWGNYTLQGTTLSETPTGAQVANGPNPNELCNLQTDQCAALDLGPDTEQIQVVDANTIKTSDATATRMQ